MSLPALQAWEAYALEEVSRLSPALDVVVVLLAYFRTVTYHQRLRSLTSLPHGTRLNVLVHYLFRLAIATETHRSNRLVILLSSLFVQHNLLALSDVALFNVVLSYLYL